MRQSSQTFILAACLGGLLALVPAAAGAAPAPSSEDQGRGLVVTGIALEIVGAAALVTGGVFSYLVGKTSDDANNLTSGGKVVQGTDLLTKQADGKVRNYGPTVCIDTGAYAPDGWLTCLDVTTGRYWQADQQGHRRTDILEDPLDADF